MQRTQIVACEAVKSSRFRRHQNVTAPTEGGAAETGNARLPTRLQFVD